MEETIFFFGGGEKHALDQRLSVVIIKKFEHIFLSTGPQNGKIIKITKYLSYCRNSVNFYGILWSKNILKEKYLQKRWERGDILKMMTLFLLLGFLGTPI